MVKAGFSREFARRFITDAGHAYGMVLDTSIRLARHFADVQFVLRPHPFENIRSYDAFAELPNAQVIQSGTSLEWISGARLLIHQNCSTAIEASMLSVEPLSMEWFNTPALRLDAATSVSRSADSEAVLFDLVKQGLDDGLPSIASQTEVARRKIISDLYTAVDGASSSRVADVILTTIETKERGKRAAAPPPSPRGLAAAAIRRTLGYKASSALRRSYGSVDNERRRAGKVFAPEAVDLVLRRIDRASADGRNFVTQNAAGASRRTARMVSGMSLRLKEAN